MAKVILDNTDNSWTDTLGENDTVYGEGGNDTLYGGQGADVLHGGGGIDYLFGQAGNDTLYGDGSYDYLYGGDGNDVLYAGETGFWDWLYGGAGNDTLFGKTLFGGAGAGYGDASGGVTVDLRITGSQNTGAAGLDTLKDIYSLSGSSFNDQLVGNNNGNSLYGQGGNDTLDGGGGDDYLNGGAGDDLLVGGAGDDDFSGGSGINTIIGGLGIDAVDFTSATQGVTTDLNLTTKQNNGQGGFDILSGIEQIYGSYYNDLLIGDAQDNKFYGDAGNDTLLGGAGNDWLLADNDMDGPVCDDYLDGGEGNDWLGGGGGEDTLLGGNGNDIINAGLYASSIVDGGAGRDAASFIWNHGVRVDLRITEAQDTGSNVVTLLNIEDIEGSGRIDGHDILIGNSANNGIWGVQGNDWLTGGLGADTLSGGSGEDCFIYEKKTESTLLTTDTIKDFATGDHFVLNGMAGISVMTTAYSWKGSAANTLSAIRGDAALNNVAVFFTNGKDGWLTIKGKGRGQDFDNTVIELTGRKTPLRVEDIITRLTDEDSDAPTVTGFTSTSNSRTYREGEVINITAQMSEVVQAGSNFAVTLDTGVVITLKTVADSKTLTGKYTVGAGDHSADLRITSFAAGSVHDLAGNAMTDTTLPEGHNLWDYRNIVVETGGIPTLTGLAIVSDPGTDNTYSAGDIIRMAATFNEAVNVTGNPYVKLNIGGNTIRPTKYISGSGTNTLTYEYTVQATDADSNGVSIGTSALALGAGGAIRDSAGNNAILTNLALADNAGHKVAGTVFLRISSAADSKGNFTVGLYNSDGTTARAQGDIRLTYTVSGGLTGNPPVLSIKDGQTSGQITITGATSTVQTVTLNNTVNKTGVQVDLEHNVGQYLPSAATSNNGPKLVSVAVNNERTQVTMTFDQAVSKISANPGTIDFLNLTKDPDVADPMSSFNVIANRIIVNFATALEAGCEYEIRMNDDVLNDFSGLGVRDARFATSGTIPDAIKSLLPVKADQFPASATKYAQGYNTEFSHGIDGQVVSDSNAKFALDISENSDVFSLFDGGTVKGVTKGRNNGDGSYGNTVTVEYTVNGRTFYATYAHLESVSVNKDDHVDRGTVLGNAGNTGGPKGMAVHLHLQIGDSLNGTVASGRSQVAPTVYFQRFLDNETDGLPDGWTGKVRATDIFGTDATGTGSAIERLIGSDASERVFGFDGMDFLEGQGGHDELYGGSGNDTIMGGMGNDLLRGGADADSLDGGNDDDEMYGGDGKDILTGGWGNDLMYGEEGADSLEGKQGNDTLHGGDDEDSLFGGDNDDILHGGLGAYDVMNGGGGKDTFYFEHPNEGDSINNPYNRNTIEDFKTGRDVVAFLDSNFGFGDLGDDTRLTDLQVEGESRFISAATIDECKILRDSGTIDTAVFLYASTTGGLYFDRDGKDSTYAPVHIAKIGGDRLTEGDIIIVSQNIV